MVCVKCNDSQLTEKLALVVVCFLIKKKRKIQHDVVSEVTKSH